MSNLLPLWSDEIVAQLRSSVAAGKKASKIAEELSARVGYTVTRNAVIGKMNRLGLGLKKKVIRQGNTIVVVKRNASYAKTFAANMAQRGNHQGKLATELSIPNDAPAPIFTSLRDIKDSECHWPYEDGDGKIVYCGHEGVGGGVQYCAFHRRLKYQPVRRRRNVSAYSKLYTANRGV